MKETKIVIASNIKVANTREVHNFLEKGISALARRRPLHGGSGCQINIWKGRWLGCKLSGSAAVLHFQNGMLIFRALAALLFLLLLLYSDSTTKIVLALIMFKRSRNNKDRDERGSITIFEGETSNITCIAKLTCVKLVPS